MGNEIENSWISIESARGGSFGAFVSYPPQGFGPGLLVLQEIFGVTEHIRGVCNQYALDGFVTIAPDIFWRNGPRTELCYDSSSTQKGLELFDQLNIDMVASDLQRTVEALKHIPACTGRIASLGFCMGGLLSFVAAARANVDTSIIYYGSRLEMYLDLINDVTCPLLFHFAQNDSHVSSEVVLQVRKATKGRKNCRIITHEDCDHGFNCWDRNSWNHKVATTARGQSLVHLMESIP